jgi:hypothetical protein
MDHRRQAALRMVKCCEQTLDAPERQVDRLRVERLQALKQRDASRD